VPIAGKDKYKPHCEEDSGLETFEKCPILFKVKEGDNFCRPGEICFAFHRASRNILNISRINPPQAG
jgi:hypothetical protein